MFWIKYQRLLPWNMLMCPGDILRTINYRNIAIKHPLRCVSFNSTNVIIIAYYIQTLNHIALLNCKVNI